MSHDTHYLHEIHGDTPAGKNVDRLTKDERLRFGKAVLVIAAADGKLETAEMDYFLGMARAFGGLTDDQLSEFRDFDYRKAKLEDLLSPEYRGLGRGFLYDAIRVASCDGLHDQERAAAHTAGKLLNIEASVVDAIVRQIELEVAVRNSRLALLHPTR